MMVGAQLTGCALLQILHVNTLKMHILWGKCISLFLEGVLFSGKCMQLYFLEDAYKNA